MFPVWQQCICGIAEHFANISCVFDAAVEIGIIRDVNRHHHLHFIEVVKTFFFGFFVVGELGIFIKQFLNFQTYGIGYRFPEFNEFIQCVGFENIFIQAFNFIKKSVIVHGCQINDQITDARTAGNIFLVENRHSKRNVVN